MKDRDKAREREQQKMVKLPDDFPKIETYKVQKATTVGIHLAKFKKRIETENIAKENLAKVFLRSVQGPVGEQLVEVRKEYIRTEKKEIPMGRLYKEFLIRAVAPGYQSKLAEEMLDMKQGKDEEVVTFMNRVVKIPDALEWSRDDPWVKLQFVRGLKPEIAGKVKVKLAEDDYAFDKKISLQSLLWKAQAIEREVQLEGTWKEKEATPPPVYNPPSYQYPPPPGFTPTPGSTPTPGFTPTPGVPGVPRTLAAGRGRGSGTPFSCFHCQLPDHYARDCRRNPVSPNYDPKLRPVTEKRLQELKAQSQARDRTGEPPPTMSQLNTPQSPSKQQQWEHSKQEEQNQLLRTPAKRAERRERKQIRHQRIQETRRSSDAGGAEKWAIRQ